MTFSLRLPLWCLLALWFANQAPVHAQGPFGSSQTLLGNQVCFTELAKLADHIQGNLFYIKRSLANYRTELGPGFIESLRSLGPEDQWLDAGSGSGLAQAEYQTGRNMGDVRFVIEHTAVPKMGPGARAKTLGVTVVLPRFGIENRDRLVKEGYGDRNTVLVGKFIEDIPAQTLGKNRIITDVYGPLAYTTDPARVIDRYLEVLTANGEIFVKLTETRSFVRMRDGTSCYLEDYIAKAMVGHHVQKFVDATLRIQLRPEGIKKFPKLKLVEIRDDAPPFRVFEEVSE